jgi:hypothetical protein
MQLTWWSAEYSGMRKTGMTQWQNQNLWSTAWIYAFLALLLLTSDGSTPNWLGEGSSSRKRAFALRFRGCV